MDVMVNNTCRFVKGLIFRIVFAVVMYSFLSAPAGSLHCMEKDPDRDGPVAQARMYDDTGNSLRVETDNDKKIDRIDYIENGRRSCQEIFDAQGNLIQVSVFDETEQVSLIREDTTGSGRLDMVYSFKDRRLLSSTRDTDENGKANEWTRFENRLPVEQKQDDNEDGIMDRILFFDDQGRLLNIREDTDGNGKTDRIRQYKEGKLSRIRQDTAGDGYFEILETYDDPFWSVIVSLDSNADKNMDIGFFYKNAVLRRKEMDADFDDIPDVIEIFNEAGALEKIEEKRKGKTVLTWFYAAGEIPTRAEEDRNGDGKVEIWYLYENGKLKRVLEDTNLDGKHDLWETYDETRAVVKREKDLDFDGVPDVVGRVGDADKDK